MTRIKNSLSGQSAREKISRLRIVAGIAVGLFFSFAFYAFLYISREVFRLLSLTDTYDLWVLTDKEVYFYNLIFAFIAVIMGQSITFTFWFHFPGKLRLKRSYRKTAIINDQQALNWYFISWFSKLAIVFATLFGLAWHRGFYVFSFYPSYNYLFILVVVVLFLHTWTTLRLVFKRKSLKWMLYSAALISMLAFGLSRINLIDYKRINQNYLNYNIYHSYTLDLPKTNSYEVLKRRSLVTNIYVVLPKVEPLHSSPVIVVENERITLAELPQKIASGSEKNPLDISAQVYCLHIHKSVKMSLVNQLKQELSKAWITNIAYAVIPEHHELDKRYYRYHSFPVWLPNTLAPSSVKINGKDSISIRYNKNGCFVNGKTVQWNQLKTMLKRLIEQNPDCIIRVGVDEQTEFSDYFFLLSEAKTAIDELKNEYAEKEYYLPFKSLGYEERIRVLEKFPFYIFDQ